MGREYVTTRDRIADLFVAYGYRGLTWKEVAAITGEHHGKVSGALSALHAEHRVARLRSKRDGCAVYVHPEMVGHRPLAPIRARVDWKERATRAEAVLDAVREGRVRRWGKEFVGVGAVHEDPPVYADWKVHAAAMVIADATAAGHTVVGPVEFREPARDGTGLWVHRAVVPVIPGGDG